MPQVDHLRVTCPRYDTKKAPTMDYKQYWYSALSLWTTPLVQLGRQENRPREHNMVSGNGRRLETVGPILSGATTFYTIFSYVTKLCIEKE
eukprot:scaffold222129_cov57-Attheya_sp.AAC.4